MYPPSREISNELCVRFESTINPQKQQNDSLNNELTTLIQTLQSHNYKTTDARTDRYEIDKDNNKKKNINNQQDCFIPKPRTL